MLSKDHHQSLTSRLIFLYWFFTSINMLAFQPLSAQPTPSPPNVILFIADDVGWNDLGCYGNPAVFTPHIDRIAQEGIRFTNAYLTASSCSPSRTSIISGRYPHNTGSAELHTPLPAEVAIFPELLRQVGYYTAQAGKWHMGEAARRGFDVVRDQDSGNGGEKQWLPTLRERPRNQPFFMWFAAHDAHRVWGPNEFSGKNRADAITPPPFLADTDSTKQDLAHYYDEITRFDDYIGKVEQELRQQGVLDNTIIIIMSDNGRPFPRSKTRVYDSGMQTPLVMKWNDGLPQPGAVSSSLISVIDIAPTLLELAGVDVPASFQGKSFAPVLQDPTRTFRNYVFSEHNWHDHEALERMVRTPDYLYVLNLRPNLSNPGPADSNGSPSFQDLKDLREAGQLTAAQVDVFMVPRPSEELYNCRDDPFQLANVASLAAYQDTLLALRQVLQRWRQETHDTTPKQLTGDWYNRETGEPLDREHSRGEMPGGEEAVRTNARGPF